jgi:hypothetical protein
MDKTLAAMESALRAPPMRLRASVASFAFAIVQCAAYGLAIGMGIGAGLALAGV